MSADTCCQMLPAVFPASTLRTALAASPGVIQPARSPAQFGPLSRMWFHGASSPVSAMPMSCSVGRRFFARRRSRSASAPSGSSPISRLASPPIMRPVSRP